MSAAGRMSRSAISSRLPAGPPHAGRRSGPGPWSRLHAPRECNGSAAGGCHRSDVAEVHSAQLPTGRRVDILLGRGEDRPAALLQPRHERRRRAAAGRSAAAAAGPPPPVGSEWGRAVSASTIAQGQTQELFHPNAYGQMALGDCVGAMYAARRGSYACTGGAGRAPGDMLLTPLR